MLKKIITVLTLTAALCTAKAENNPSLSQQNIQELFSVVTEYCQHKMAAGDEMEKEVFGFMLNAIEQKNALRVAAQYDTGRVWFIEPQTGIHIMVVPKSYMVEDRELAAELSRILGHVNEAFFSGKYPGYTPVGAEILVDLATWTDPTAPRNSVNVEFQVKFQNKTGSFELADFRGRVNTNFSEKSFRNVSDIEIQIKNLETELTKLEKELEKVQNSDSYSKELAIRRLMSEIEDVQRRIQELKKSL
ncbi:MAG: hypothetical protein PHQ23_02960 [Candidatus Wallbacteria bacterium]|nr:hypothetical protein [Candidatus Wallbacteria bacterium]